MVCIIEVINCSLPSEKQEEFKRMGINTLRINLLKNNEGTGFAEQQSRKIDLNKVNDIHRMVTGHHKRKGYAMRKF